MSSSSEFVKKENKGKENQQNANDRKRLYKKDEDEEEDQLIKPKKRRVIIPDIDSDEDSGDEFKPGLWIIHSNVHNYVVELSLF